MGKKKKKKKRKPSKNDPIQCADCAHCECDMEKVGKNHYISKYICSLHNNNEVPHDPLILIPKWCPKGYKNLFG